MTLTLPERLGKLNYYDSTHPGNIERNASVSLLTSIFPDWAYYSREWFLEHHGEISDILVGIPVMIKGHRNRDSMIIRRKAVIQDIRFEGDDKSPYIKLIFGEEDDMDFISRSALIFGSNPEDYAHGALKRTKTVKYLEKIFGKDVLKLQGKAYYSNSVCLVSDGYLMIQLPTS